MYIIVCTNIAVTFTRCVESVKLTQTRSMKSFHLNFESLFKLFTVQLHNQEPATDAQRLGCHANIPD